jgi:hypothetical protein
MKEDILFYAFRYALGRMTYAVGQVSDEIIRVAANLSPGVRNVMIREIDEADKSERLGMQMDAARWYRVRAALVELEKQTEPIDHPPFPCPTPNLDEHCSGCTDPRSEGTHAGCTIEHGHVCCDLAGSAPKKKRGRGTRKHGGV